VRKICPALFGGILIAFAIPASAGWDEVGSIIVHDQGERFMRDLSVRVPIEKLRLKADDSDIFCRSIEANFPDGSSQEIFEGILRQSRLTDIELPPEKRDVKSLTFQCGALIQGSAEIHVIVGS
jgi:hypothetical protein